MEHYTYTVQSGTMSAVSGWQSKSVTRNWQTVNDV